MEPAPNILVLMEDALRYDAYYSAVMTSVRRALQPSREYANWYSPSNCSDPSIASMLTGLYPWKHGVRRMGDPLNRETVIDHLRDMGYVTIFAGWPTEWILRSCDKTWWYYGPGKIARQRHHTTSNAVYLIRSADQPWFAFVRHMWCHAQYVRSNYQASVEATVDDLLPFIHWIRNNHPHTVIILTADHGEMLHSDRERISAKSIPPQHAWGLFEPQVHVPMVVSHSGMGNTIDDNYYQHDDAYDLILGIKPRPKEYVLFEGTGVDRKFAGWYHRGVLWKKGVKLIYGGVHGSKPHAYLYFRGVNGYTDESDDEAKLNPDLVHDLMQKLPPALAYTLAEEAQVLSRLEALGYEDM